MTCLLREGRRVLSREDIIEAVWGPSSLVLARTVDAHIRALRKKLGDAKGELETVQGVGYRMCQRQKNKLDKGNANWEQSFTSS